MTDDLRVRSKPGVSASSAKLEPLLWKDARAFVIDGPAPASGYDWYLIEPIREIDGSSHPDPPRVGWVAAAGKDGKPWLATAPIECPASPVDALRDELLFPPLDRQRLACFGPDTLRFVARLGRRETLPSPWRTVPTWLDPYEPPYYVLADPKSAAYLGEVPSLYVALDPAVNPRTLPPFDATGWVLVNVAGRYDHPAARSCRPEATYASEIPKPPLQLVVLDCRARFVMTSVTAFEAP